MQENSISRKKIAILGSTGSIGKQALEVIRNNPGTLEVSLLTANNNYRELIAQAREFQPDSVVICNQDHYLEVKSALKNDLIKVYSGIDSLEMLVQMDSVDIVVTAMVGFAGLKSTIKAIEAGKTIALANKETLVVAGDLICRLVIENRSKVIPVDSEHSAIFQCLIGEGDNEIEKIILTASGGPFRGYQFEKLKSITPSEALKHPNWNMGHKITIDSATLMNKGLEMIEARWLFNLSPDQIEVLVHPQSIIHSMVQFTDGSVKAQLGMPDMRLPIQYAFFYPSRVKNDYPRIDFSTYKDLTFEKVDTKTFRSIVLAYDAMMNGGNKACILNAANEVAVEAFLKERISFLQLPDIVEEALCSIRFIKEPSLSDYFETDKETRIFTQNLIYK